MPDAETSLATDIIQKLGETALDAVLGSAGSAIWDQFFPSPPSMFSQKQLDQMATLFNNIFGDQAYTQAKDKFTSSSRSLTEYVNNPSGAKLALLESNLEDEVLDVKRHGYTTAQVYLTVAGQYLLSQRLDLDATAKEHPDHVEGARRNIAAAAVNTLNDLVDLEAGYGQAVGWADYVAFKRYTVLREGSMPATAVTAFGSDYADNVQKLLAVVNEYDPATLDQVRRPPYMLLIAPFDQAQFPAVWGAWSGNYSTELVLRKSPAQLSGISSDYRPLGDIAWYQPMHSEPDAPAAVIYIAEHTAKFVDPTGWRQIYNDHGSGYKTDYAGFWSQQPGQDGNPTPGIGSWIATNDNASTPDDAGRVKLVDSAYYMPVRLPAASWDDQATGIIQDGTVYKHPQFGDYGIHIIERSHTRPDPDTVPGLKWEAIAGHPELQAK